MANNKEMVKEEGRRSSVWDPLGALRASIGFPDLFEDLFAGLPTPRVSTFARAWLPKVNIKETDKQYVITAALPGVKKEDVKIEVRNGVLTIAGEQKEEKEEKGKDYLRREMSFGSFQRSFVLPEGVHPEDVKASQKDGLLTVTLPKPETPKRKGVDIKVD